MCGTIIVLTVRRAYDSRKGKIRDNRKEGPIMKGLLQGISGILRRSGYDVTPGAINNSELA